MVAALGGRLEAMKHRAKQDLLLAYRTGAFAGAAFNGKLKAFEHYSRQVDEKRPRQRDGIEAIAFFHGLKAAGFAVEINRTEH